MAESCGPCKQLSPVLEKLAAEADGKWILAKVDVDANPQLAAALQVQSIPMVVAVIGGQLVDGFLGAMPEAQVRQWLGQVMGIAEKQGLVPPGTADTEADGSSDPADREPPNPPAFAEARRPWNAATWTRRQCLRAGAGRVAGRPGRQGGPGAGQPDPPGQLLRSGSFRREAAERPGDVQAQIAVADIDLATGRIEEAFDRLLGVVRRTSGEDRDRARGTWSACSTSSRRVTRG